MPSTRTRQSTMIDPDDIETTPTGVVVPMGDTPSSDDEPDAQQNIVDRLRSILASDPSDNVYVRLYRANPKTGKYDYCRRYGAHEFESDDLDSIRAEWGPGDYEFRIINSKGNAARVRQSIAPSYAPAVANQPAQPVAQSSEITQALAALLQSQQQIAQALQTRPDPMAQFTQFAALAASFREMFAPAQSNAPQRNSMAELKELLEMSREVKATAKELAGDDEKPDPDNPMALLSQGLDMVKTAMANQAQQPRIIPDAGPLQPLALPVSMQQAPSNTDPEPPHNPAPETAEELLMRGTIEDLCQLSIDGKPASDGAEFIFEHLPDSLIPMMGNRYWFEIIAMKFPIIKQHEAWIREAKAGADKLFAEDDGSSTGADR